jgi:hypothetical protein
MPLYTFLMEFRGGTYCSQVHAASPKRAPAVWARKLNPEDVWGFGPSSRQQLEQDFKVWGFVPLDGTKNVWCHTAYIHGHPALINFVETVGS